MTHRTSLRSRCSLSLRSLAVEDLRPSVPTAWGRATALLGALLIASVGLAGCDVGAGLAGDVVGDEDGQADETRSAPRPERDGTERCDGDCGGDDLGFAARSCADLLDVNPKAPSGVYRISPPGVSKPFRVYCDMTTDGGGWTALPLRFADPKFWSIERSGADCVDVTETEDGAYSQHQVVQMEGFADTAFKFVPGIEVREVRFVGLGVATSGGTNTMDIAVGAISTAKHTESWWLADADPTVARGFVFADAACPAPLVAATWGTAQCTLDPTPTAEVMTLERYVAYDQAAPVFQTVVRESCMSNLPTNVDEGEAFTLRAAAGRDGIWRRGIFVR